MDIVFAQSLLHFSVGISPSESKQVKVCGLTWQDINLEEQYLTVKRSVRYDGAKHKTIIGPTKRKKLAFQGSRPVLNIQMRFRCNPPEYPACSPCCNTHSKPCFYPAQPISHDDYEKLIAYLEKKNVSAVLPIQIAYYAGSAQISSSSPSVMLSAFAMNFFSS